MPSSFDAAALVKEYGGREFVRELARLLIESAPPQMDAIRRASETRDGEALRAACHKLRGSLAAFGVPEVVQILRSLEGVGTDPLMMDADGLISTLAGNVQTLCEDARTWLRGRAPELPRP